MAQVLRLKLMLRANFETQMELLLTLKFGVQAFPMRSGDFRTLETSVSAGNPVALPPLSNILGDLLGAIKS